ncbi:unnamed protein product, partial [Sphacelaria rigidula]
MKRSCRTRRSSFSMTAAAAAAASAAIVANNISGGGGRGGGIDFAQAFCTSDPGTSIHRHRHQQPRQHQHQRRPACSRVLPLTTPTHDAHGSTTRRRCRGSSKDRLLMGYNGSGQGGVTSRGSSGVRSWGEGGVATMHLTRPRAVAPLGAGADQDIRAHVTATGGSSSGGGGLNGASSARVEAQGVEGEQAAVISSGQRLRRTGR